MGWDGDGGRWGGWGWGSLSGDLLRKMARAKTKSLPRMKLSWHHSAMSPPCESSVMVVSVFPSTVRSEKVYSTFSDQQLIVAKMSRDTLQLTSAGRVGSANMAVLYNSCTERVTALPCLCLLYLLVA